MYPPYPPAQSGWIPKNQPTTGRSAAGETLLLVGAIVGLVFLAISILWATVMYFAFSAADAGLRNMDNGPSSGFFGNLWGAMSVVMALFGLLNLVGAILALNARRELVQSGGARGSVKAIVGGAIMLPGSVIGGILVLIGAILCNSAKPQPTFPPAGRPY